MNSKLRVALLIDSPRVPQWAYRLVETIQQSSYAQVTLVLQNTSGTTSHRQRLTRLWRSRSQGLYLLHRKLERRLWKARFDAFRSSLIKELVPEATWVEVQARQTEFSDWFPLDICELVRQQEIDVAIRLGFRILRGEILDAPRYGIWSYHHGDAETNRGGPPAFWEVMENREVTGATLQVLSENLDAGQVLARTWVSTEATFVGRNKNTLYWSALPLLPRMLERLHTLGEERFFAEVRALNSGPRLYSGPLYKVPSNPQFFSLLPPYVGRLLAKAWKRYRSKEQWKLLYHLESSEDLSFSGRHFKVIEPDPGREWADPFVVSQGENYYVFFEDLVIESGRGHISFIEISPNGELSSPQVALQRNYHLSYPFVFEHEGEYYMIPESGENRTIELYRAVEFPHRWELAKVLMSDVIATDSTLLYEKGRWWLFACFREREEIPSGHELMAFFTEDLLNGPWTPHAQNPIVSDARSARPAGQFIRHAGKLYRPSQNCGRMYGHSMKFNEVVELSPVVYKERCVAEITPDWSPEIQRTHTFNRVGQLTMIDGKFQVPR